jgi:hypothetical protein
VTIRDTIQAAFAGIAGGNVFEQAAPDTQQPDYVVWAVINADPHNDLGGGDAALYELRLQIDCWGTTIAAAEALLAAVKAGLDAATLKWRPLNELDAYDADTKRSGITLEVYLWTN